MAARMKKLEEAHAADKKPVPTIERVKSVPFSKEKQKATFQKAKNEYANNVKKALTDPEAAELYHRRELKNPELTDRKLSLKSALRSLKRKGN